MSTQSNTSPFIQSVAFFTVTSPISSGGNSQARHTERVERYFYNEKVTRVINVKLDESVLNYVFTVEHISGEANCDVLPRLRNQADRLRSGGFGVKDLYLTSVTFQTVEI